MTDNYKEDKGKGMYQTKFILQQATNTQTGSRGIALLLL